MRYSIIFLCVEVVSYVLRVEVCLGRAHTYFQDGVISDPVTLVRDSHPGWRAAVVLFLSLSPAIMSAICRFLGPREDMHTAQSVYIRPQSAERFTCLSGLDRDTSLGHHPRIHIFRGDNSKAIHVYLFHQWDFRWETKTCSNIQFIYIYLNTEV
jgi:hypothetical protein